MPSQPEVAQPQSTPPAVEDRRDPGPAAGPRPDADLLDAVLRAGTTAPGRSAPLDQFLAAASTGEALVQWLGLAGTTGPLPTRDEVTRVLARDIVKIDALLAAQVDAILHHPAFQKLEASWRGLRYLVGRIPDDNSVKVRVLGASWAELVQDQTRALEFDQSQLFRRVYEAEFGHPGGEPFGVLVGDYEIHHRPSPEHPFDDIETLSKLSGVAAAAFAPLVTGVHPTFFGLDRFDELDRPIDLSAVFEQVDYLKWRAFRQTEDSRFVGLTMPRVLMRLPYETGRVRGAGFQYTEGVSGTDRDKYLWGNAAYAFAGVLVRCYSHSGWLADIRGVRQGEGVDGQRVCLDEGGLVGDLPVHSFRTDRLGVARKFSTELVITDGLEKTLDGLGFIPLCHCHDTELSAFYGNPSVQRPQTYDDPKATANARLSAMLQYMLCVSRFAHYIKVMSRDKIGSSAGPEDIEGQLQRWLQSYTTASDTAGQELKAKYPLREAKVQVREDPARPGCYRCVVHLRPHFQLDQMHTAIRFRTELAPAQPG